MGSPEEAFQRDEMVLISRLRPYLRQVAFVDKDIGDGHAVELACSTEFFVLRSLTAEPIGFSVPTCFFSRRRACYPPLKKADIIRVSLKML